MRRRFEFETLYLDKDFTLASLATMRPDGAVKSDGQMPFSEVSLWRLAAKGGQIFGNAGANDTMTGRCPFEEIAQYGNVMLRAVKGTDVMWVAVPRAMKVEIADGAVRVRLGDGLSARFTAQGRQSGVAMPRHAPWSDPAYEQYVWTFAPGELAALAMEVGRGKLDGTLSMEEDDIVRYRFDGKELKLQFVAPVTYMMTDARVVKPAGTVPRAWRDGIAMGFQRWDTYRVVAGKKIVEQKWGGDTLDAMGLKIRVDRSHRPHRALVGRRSPCVVCQLIQLPSFRAIPTLPQGSGVRGRDSDASRSFGRISPVQVSGLSCKIRRSPTAKLPRARDVACWALKDCVTRRFFIGVSFTRIYRVPSGTSLFHGAGAEYTDGRRGVFGAFAPGTGLLAR